MPELPEVETSRLGIAPWIAGHAILWTEVHNAQLRWPVDEKIISLRDSQVLSVQRRAKYLLLELAHAWIMIHFGMSGCLRVLHQPQPLEKHDHIDLVISNGCIIRYNDPRRFGSWLWCNNLLTSRLLVNLGIEPLSDQFNSQLLYEQSRNKHKPIKQFLMDNKLVVGIGNIYASESLFVAGILPSRSASSLSTEESTLLVNSIKQVLLRSIQHGGTTSKDFLQPDGKPGSFIKELKVYGRTGEPCSTCGRPIQVTKHSQRSTFFCYECQH